MMNDLDACGFCPKCGKQASSGAAFCDQCGAALQTSHQRFRVYNYSEAEARANGIRASYNQLFVVVGAFVFAIVATLIAVAVIGAAKFGLRSPAREIVGGISCVVLIAGTIVYALSRRKYTLASQYAYVWDSADKVLYSVLMIDTRTCGRNLLMAPNMVATTINSANTADPRKRAQNDGLCIAYVQRYIESGKPAQKFWTMTAPSEVVVELKDIKVLKSTRRSVTVQYTNFKGKAKKMTIVKAFPGIEECYV